MLSANFKYLGALRGQISLAPSTDACKQLVAVVLGEVIFHDYPLNDCFGRIVSRLFKVGLNRNWSDILRSLRNELKDKKMF